MRAGWNSGSFGAFFNGDSYKGYEYTTARPHSVRASLDGYQVSDSEKGFGGWLVHAPLGGNWYLYLFVSG